MSAALPSIVIDKSSWGEGPWQDEPDRVPTALTSYDRERGRPAARAGVFNHETKEFTPGREVPEENRFCYRIEPAASARQ